MVSETQSHSLNTPSLLVAIAASIGFLSRPGNAMAQVSAADSAWFVATTQSLLDAVTNGDSTTWAAVLAPDWLMSDEEGNRPTRATFLASLHPLASGQHGKLTLADWHLVGDSTLAVFSYDADEWHDYYGQVLRTRFRTSDTWIKRRGRWLQLASSVTALPTQIAGVAISSATAREYAGEYALTPEIRIRVVATDSGLALQSQGHPPQPLRALDDRLFVRDGSRGFWVFELTGRSVTRLVNWRDNNPVVWRRVQ